MCERRPQVDLKIVICLEKLTWQGLVESYKTKSVIFASNSGLFREWKLTCTYRIYLWDDPLKCPQINIKPSQLKSKKLGKTPIFTRANMIYDGTRSAVWQHPKTPLFRATLHEAPQLLLRSGWPWNQRAMSRGRVLWYDLPLFSADNVIRNLKLRFLQKKGLNLSGIFKVLFFGVCCFHGHEIERCWRRERSWSSTWR